MAQIVEIFLWVRKVPIHAVNTIVGDDRAIQGARLSVALYWLCLPGILGGGGHSGSKSVGVHRSKFKMGPNKIWIKW